jgi:hypothetical protein
MLIDDLLILWQALVEICDCIFVFAEQFGLARISFSCLELSVLGDQATRVMLQTLIRLSAYTGAP